MNAESKSLRLIGLARRSGRMVYGVETLIANARDIVLILLAKDAGMAVERKAQRVAETTNVQIVRVPFDKTQMGWTVGLQTCAVLGIVDKGFATNIQHQLEEECRSAR